MSKPPAVRLLTPEDLPEALELSCLAGWNQNLDDWRMLLELAPEGCYGIEMGGKIVATTTLLCYPNPLATCPGENAALDSSSLAWLGMVLTHPDYHRRGFARTLLQHVLERARSLAIRTVKLDATDAGRPLYENFGFRAEQPVERWVLHRESRQDLAIPCGSHLSKSALDDICQLDRNACGYDRKSLLQKLLTRSRAFAAESGYLLTRPGRLWSYLGPCIATNAVTAERLITLPLQFSEGWCWDLLPRNESAVTIARKQGFIRHRQLLRMVLGDETPVAGELVYAIAGFELGYANS